MFVFSVMCRKDCYVLFKRLHFNLQWKHIDIRVPQRIIRKDSGDSRTVFLCRNNSIQTFTETNTLVYDEVS